ncbi:MAG: DUF6807 family protein [Phycisphaeraceae bacterium]|nr:DUF6807 family protein [Phycisphaeraceae bacterium]
MQTFCHKVFWVGCLALMLAAGRAEAAFSINKVEGSHIDVAYNKKPILRLMIGNDTSDEKKAHETYKVYAHVMDPTDPEGERRLTKGAGHKYTHHRGIYIGWARAKVEGVGRVDTWHMKNGVRQHFGKILKKETGPESATLSVSVDWVKNDQPLMSEVRTFVVHKPSAKGELLIDKSSTITATVGKTQLTGDPEHAGLQYRAHEQVVKNKSAEYLFPDGKKPGKKGDKDMPWAAMTYKIGDRKFHVQHMSHPSLPKGNIYSAYRDYGRFGAYFVKNLDKGESATFKVRFYISPGGFPEDAEAQMKKRYAEYVAEVK